MALASMQIEPLPSRTTSRLDPGQQAVSRAVACTVPAPSKAADVNPSRHSAIGLDPPCASDPRTTASRQVNPWPRGDNTARLLAWFRRKWIGPAGIPGGSCIPGHDLPGGDRGELQSSDPGGPGLPPVRRPCNTAVDRPLRLRVCDRRDLRTAWRHSESCSQWRGVSRDSGTSWAAIRCGKSQGIDRESRGGLPALPTAKRAPERIRKFVATRRTAAPATDVSSSKALRCPPVDHGEHESIRRRRRPL